MSNSISALLEPHVETSPAVLAPDRPPLTFAGLRALTESTVRRLNELGIGRGDRVAIVLPNGPEMATAFLTIACGATTAPLNPAYREEELDFYLTDLRARALVVTEAESGPRRRGRPPPRRASATPARPRWRPGRPVRAAPGSRRRRPACCPRRRGRPRRRRPGAAHLGHHLAAQDRAAPASQPRGLGPPYRRRAGAHPGRPLPQRHAAVPHPRPDRGGARARWRPAPRSTARPASTPSASSPGSTTRRPPGTRPSRPCTRRSWPAPARNAEAIARARLRLIRSSSASLPPQVMRELEATFGCPVIESYGMTEAAHQMASNPLPPRAAQARHRRHRRGPARPQRRPGGPVRAGGRAGRGRDLRPERHARLREQPRRQRQGLLRGRRPALVPHRRRGLLDEEGYLRITGRLKEIINRGGEKVSPLEVDEVLMDHPAVAQVVTFAMPHDKLGEEVAAAVVLRDGATAERERAARLRRRPACRLQGAAPDRHPARDPERGHRQAAADRPRPEARPRLMRVAVYGAGAIGGLLGA